MIRLSIVFICTLLLLAGCASYTAKPIDAGVQQAALESRRLDAPELRQFIERAEGRTVGPWPPAAWGLDSLTLAAFYFHPDLDRAQAQRLVAEAAIVTAGARPNPTGGVSFQRSDNPPADASPWTNGLTLDIPVETAGKRDIRIEEAQQIARAAKLREAEAIWQVRSRVRASLLAAYPTEALVKSQRDLEEQIERLIENRFAAGFASQPELTQARLALNRITLALQETQKQRAENLARLAAAVGVPAAALTGTAISYDAFTHLPPLSALPPEEARRQALLTRPDVLAALADYDASQAALQLEIAKQYPDISLGPGYTWDQGQVKWSLGLSLVLPLLNRNQGPIAEAKARREEAAAAFLAVQAKAIAEVDEALAGYGHAIQMLETADALLRDQQKTERAAAVAFQAGEADRLTWISARFETAAAQLARVNALSQAQQNLGRLEDALRRPVGTPGISTEQVMSAKPHRFRE